MVARSELLYWDGSNWCNTKHRYWDGDSWENDPDDASPQTSYPTDTNPVISIELIDVVGNPRYAKVILSNRADDFTSTTTAEQQGRFTGVFTDFQDIRIRDAENGYILLAGKVYDMKDKFDMGTGATIDLTIKDNLEELRNNKTTTWPPYTAITGGTTKRSDVIKALIAGDVTYLNSQVISTSDSDKIDDSVGLFNDDTSDLVFKGNRSALQEVATQATVEPHSNDKTESDYGYDYHVDPSVVSSAANVAAPSQAWNYYQRGTRPHTTPATYGMTITLPVATVVTEDGFNRRMHTEFSFEEPKEELFTDVLLEYNDPGKAITGAGTVTDTSAGYQSIPRRRRFERINVTANGGSSSGVFTINPTAGSSAVGKPFGQSEIVKFTATDGSPSNANFGRIEYQSHTSGTQAGFIVVSPLTDSNGNAIRFNASFPEEAGTITGLDSEATATTGANPRYAKTIGIRKTRTYRNSNTTSPFDLRKEIVASLSRNTSTIKRGAYRINNYPYTYIEAAAGNLDIDYAANDAEVTFSGSYAFSPRGLNDPRTFGAKIGDTICEMNSTDTDVVTRYAYISATSADSVTYGGGTEANTSDGTQLDDSKAMRIFIGMKAGHVAHIKNTIAGVDGVHLITRLKYVESLDASYTEFESVGEADARGAFKPNLYSQIAEASDDHGPAMRSPILDFPKVPAGWVCTCAFTSTNTTTVSWGSGTLYSNDGEHTYAIGSGSTGTMSAASMIYLDPGTSITAFQVATQAAFKENQKYLKIAKAVNQTSPMTATFQTFDDITLAGDQTGFISKGDTILTPNSITSTLSKKGMQGWATDLVFEATDWNIIKWHEVNEADDQDGEVSFADDSTAEPITHDTGKTFSGGDLGKTVYCYKRVGDSINPVLVFTQVLEDLYKDDRILMATFVVAGSDDGTDGPSIFPFNGGQATLSAGLIRAGAIIANNLEAEMTISTTIQTSGSANTGIKLVGASNALRVYEGTLEFYNSSGYSRGTFRAQDWTWADSTVRPGLAVYGPSTSSLSSPTIANLALFGYQVGNSSQTYDAISGLTANTSMLVYGSGEFKGSDGTNPARVFFTDSDGSPSGAIHVASGVPYNTKADLDTTQRLLVMDNDTTLGSDHFKFDMINDGGTYRKMMHSSNTTQDGTSGDSFTYIGTYDNGGTWTYLPMTLTASYYLLGGAGTASLPAHSFSDDPNTGFYRIASGHTGYSDDGTLRVNLGGHSFAPTGDDTHTLEFSVAGSGGFSSYLYSASCRPTDDDEKDLGSSTYRWDDVYATNNTIQTSDIRLKEDITPTKLGLDFINDLNPVSYKWKNKKKGKHDQKHYGIIAQEVIESLKKYGIDSLDDFGGLHKDITGEDDRYGARYSEFIPILMKAVQELSAELKELKEKN